jgi:cobalt-zinc-cadmium efflux system protein
MPHHHHPKPIHQNVQKAFLWGIVLNTIFVVIETFYGFLTGSLSLLTDAGHNLGDVASLILSLVALKLTKVKPSKRYTYGYKKLSILASLANGLLLFAAVIAIFWEAFQRLKYPQEIQGLKIMYVALAGIVINSISAYLFFKDKEKDLNVKGAYLHLFADALVSLGVVIGGIIIYYTHWTFVDPILSFIIGLVILYSCYQLFSESVKLVLDGVPPHIDSEEIEKIITGIQGIEKVHHMHIWALSTTENALTCKVRVATSLEKTEIKRLIKVMKHELENNDIHHSTIEVEM